MSEGHTTPPPRWSLAGIVSGLVVRLCVLVAFAAASSQPFWSVLANLMLLAAGLASVLAISHREPLLSSTLTHWDEAALYGLIGLGLILLRGDPTAPI